MSIEHEKALIGSLLLDTKEVATCRCTSDQFIDVRLGACFDEILDADRSGRKIDELIIEDKTKTKGVTLELLADCLRSTTGPSMAVVYADKIVAEAADRSTRILLESTAKSEAIDIDATIRQLEKIRDGQARDGIKSTTAICKATLDDLQNRIEGKASLTSIKTGLSDLDRSIGGLPRGVVTIIGARTSVGKTSLATTIAVQAADRGYKVIYYSLEDCDVNIFRRFLSIWTGIGISHMIRGVVTSAELKVLREESERITKLPLTILEEIPQSASQCVQNIRAVATQKQADLVILDYIQLLREKVDKGRSRTDELALISSMLKGVAKRCNIAMVVLSQLRRLEEKGEPELQDLRESGSLEQDAHVVLLLHRRKPEDKVIDCIIAKNKDGPVHKIPLEFVGETSSFRDASEESKLKFLAGGER